MRARRLAEVMAAIRSAARGCVDPAEAKGMLMAVGMVERAEVRDDVMRTQERADTATFKAARRAAEDEIKISGAAGERRE